MLLFQASAWSVSSTFCSRKYYVFLYGRQSGVVTYYRALLTGQALGSSVHRLTEPLRRRRAHGHDRGEGGGGARRRRPPRRVRPGKFHFSHKTTFSKTLVSFDLSMRPHQPEMELSGSTLPLRGVRGVYLVYGEDGSRRKPRLAASASAAAVVAAAARPPADPVGIRATFGQKHGDTVLPFGQGLGIE